MNDRLEYAKKLVQSTAELPSIDPVVARVLQIVSDPDTSPKELSNEISKDIGLTSKVLKLSNSALFGQPRQIGRLEQAVVVLGFNEIRNLVLITSTFQLMQIGKDRELFESLWNHFVCTAIASKYLANKYAKEAVELAYIRGLLHDIGKVVLALRFPSVYRNMLDDDKNYPRNVIREERERFDCDHQVTGEVLLDKWNYPSLLVQVAGHHHKTENIDPDKISFLRLIELADTLAYIVQGFQIDEPVLKNLQSGLEVDSEEREVWISDIRERLELEKSLFSSP